MYGADFILLRVATALRSRGIFVRVILPTDVLGARPLSAALSRIDCAVEHHKLAVLRRRYFAASMVPSFAVAWAAEVRRLREILTRQRPDVVYSNTLAVTASAVAARLTGVPHLWHVHEILEEPRWLARALAKVAARLSDRVVAVSSAVDTHLRRLAPEISSVVVRNGIPDPMEAVDVPSARRRANEVLGIDDTVPLVLMIGRVSEWKGAREFVRAAEAHIRKGGKAHFALVGGAVPGERAVIEQVQRAAGDRENRGALHWIDFTSDVVPFLARASVFVLPSIRPDPFPTVVLEAMFAGLPIVAFAHGGVVEMFQSAEVGVLAPVGDCAALTAAIGCLLDNPATAKEMGRRARARALREFTRESFESRFISQLSEVASSR